MNHQNILLVVILGELKSKQLPFVLEADYDTHDFGWDIF